MRNMRITPKLPPVGAPVAAAGTPVAAVGLLGAAVGAPVGPIAATSAPLQLQALPLKATRMRTLYGCYAEPMWSPCRTCGLQPSSRQWERLWLQRERLRLQWGCLGLQWGLPRLPLQPQAPPLQPQVLPLKATGIRTQCGCYTEPMWNMRIAPKLPQVGEPVAAAGSPLAAVGCLGLQWGLLWLPLQP